MIFQETWENVISSAKTQTRRIVKPDDVPQFHTANSIRFAGATGYTGVKRGGRILYRVNQTLAVQPARTAKGIARIRIIGIRQEDVRQMSGDDARAEGFENRKQFMDVWLSMHDKPAYEIFSTGECLDTGGCVKYLWTRPTERYQAWVITFELVQPAVSENWLTSDTLIDRNW